MLDYQKIEENHFQNAYWQTKTFHLVKEDNYDF